MEPYGHCLKLSVLIKIGFVARALKRQIVFLEEKKKTSSLVSDQLSFQSLPGFPSDKVLFYALSFFEFFINFIICPHIMHSKARVPRV